MKNNSSLIYGINSIKEAIKTNENFYKVWISNEINSKKINELKEIFKSKNISFKLVPSIWFNKYRDKNHQGIVGSISPVKFYDLESLIVKNESSIFLLLDNITDTRNLGAIIRTASASGVCNIIIPNSGCAPINSETIKTSSGGIFSVKISRVNHLKDAIFILKNYDIEVVAASEKSNKILFENTFKDKVALIIGSEDKGISKSILKLCNYSLKIPMYGNLKSLNVSVSAGIFIYEILRKGKF